MIVDFLNTVDSVLYYPILIIVLAAAGIYFSIRTLFLCTATALMCLVSGVPGNADNAGAMYV